MPSIMERGREGENKSVRDKVCEKTNKKWIEIEHIEHAYIINLRLHLTDTIYHSNLWLY